MEPWIQMVLCNLVAEIVNNLMQRNGNNLTSTNGSVFKYMWKKLHHQVPKQLRGYRGWCVLTSITMVNMYNVLQ